MSSFWTERFWALGCDGVVPYRGTGFPADWFVELPHFNPRNTLES
jgi:hypothetical protein